MKNEITKTEENKTFKISKPSNDNRLDFDTLQRMAMALHKSAYFNDAKTAAQAVVKVMAGNELGIPPFSSMSNIHVIQGKLVLGSNLIASLIGKSDVYDYRVITEKGKDRSYCELEFFKHDESIGSCKFTIEEANEAGLTNKDNWKKWTSDMLFARAISRGARRFTPAIFGGVPAYVEGELGDDNVSNSINIIDHNTGISTTGSEVDE